MASEKPVISPKDVQGLFIDKDDLRKLIEESVQMSTPVRSATDSPVWKRQ